MDYSKPRVLVVVVAAVVTACGAPDEDDAARFVAVGDEGTILGSRDGMEWIAESSGTRVDLTSVAAGASTFVAVGASGTIITSRDGASWTGRESRTTIDLSHVVFHAGKFVVVGGSWESGAITLTSTDGATWTHVESPPSYMFHAVAIGSGTVIAAAYYRSDLQTPALFTSTGASSSSSAAGWSQREGPDFYDSVTVGDDIMVVGETAVSTSRDGITWTEQQLPGPRLVHGIASNGSSYVIVGELGTIYSSTNGTAWIDRSATDSNWLSGVTHGDAMFVAVGGNGTIVASQDGGASWTAAPGGTTQHLSDIVYGHLP